jgi:trans-aconitate 2-methyltransferase
VAEVTADLVVEHLGNRSSAVAADLGCGRDTTTLTLADRLPQARLVAVDLSTVVLESARARLNGDATIRVSWLCADFHHLPIREGLMVAPFLPIQLSGPS